MSAVSFKAAVLGNGQLGAMLKAAGLRIGVDIDMLDIEHGTVPGDMPVSTEREHWPVNDFTTALQQHPQWLNAAAYAALVDRRDQKTMLDQLQVPTAPWCDPTGMSQDALHARLGADVFLKSARGGYDGRGQARLKHGTAADLPEWQSAAIAESGIPFTTEVSLVAARGRDGSIVSYRLTENRHKDGILAVSLSQEGRFADLQASAEQYMARIMQHLDYVGVMAIEFFVADGKLLVNEIAPRVHNSGHWTQAGASISQFELHVRAICGFPLPQSVQTGCSAMVNLIGVGYDTSWLEQGAAQLHWYGKELRPGRKMGHLNFNHAEPGQLAEWLGALKLPAFYDEPLAWALSQLSESLSK